MAAYKEFESNKLTVRYFPDNKVVFLLPQKGIPSHYLNAIKNKMETFLPVDSVKAENGGISLKLNNNLSFSPEELFRSFGFQGGMDQEDASSVASQGAKNEVEEEEKTNPQQPQSPGIGQSGGSNAPPGGPQPNPLEQQNESLLFDLFESFWSPHKGRSKQFKRKPKKGRIYTGKRSGKYWKILERTLGRPKEKITEKDILFLRKKFGNQPFSQDRNSNLRDLDRAYHYFLSKIKREKGENSKLNFKRDYESQADLKPSDYIPGKHEKRLDNDTFHAQDDYVQPPKNENQGPTMSMMDLDLDLGEPGISYDDIDIEDEESVPEL